MWAHFTDPPPAMGERLFLWSAALRVSIDVMKLLVVSRNFYLLPAVNTEHSPV